MTIPPLEIPNDKQLAMVSHDATRHLGDNFPVQNLEGITAPYFRASLDAFNRLYEDHYRQVANREQNLPEARAQFYLAIMDAAELETKKRLPLATAIPQCIAYRMLNLMQADKERPEHDQLITSATFTHVYRFVSTAARVVGRGFVAQLVDHDPEAARKFVDFQKRQEGVEALREFFSPEGILYQHILAQNTQGERCVHERYAIRPLSHLQRPSCSADALEQQEALAPIKLVGQCGNGVYEKDVNQVANYALGESLTLCPGTAAHVKLRREVTDGQSDDHRYLAIRPDVGNIIVLRRPIEEKPKNEAKQHTMLTRLLEHLFNIKRPHYAEIHEEDL